MTIFRQRTCPKCKRNIDDDSPVCGFCKADAEREAAKREPAPPHYWLECLTEREGDTSLHVGRVKYDFKRNEHGRAVCQVNNLGHYRALLKLSDFVPYDAPEVAQEETPATIKDRIVALYAAGKTDTEIAGIIGNITRQAVTKLRKS